MAVLLFEERLSARQVNEPEDTETNTPAWELNYVGRSDSANPETELLTHAKVNLPATFGGVPRVSIQLRPVNGRSDTFDVLGQYSEGDAGTRQNTPDRPRTNDSRFEFEIGTQAEKVFQGVEGSERLFPAGIAAPMNDALNVSDTVEGHEKLVPTAQYSYLAYLPVATVEGGTYLSDVYKTVGKTNDAAFKGTAAGESLCLGCRGQLRTNGDYELRFTFGYRENVTVTAFGGIPINQSVGGWELLWARYRTDVANNVRVQVPFAAYITSLYESADFSVLLIP